MKDNGQSVVDLFVEVGVDEIDEGKFKGELSAEVQRAYEALAQFVEETGSAGAKATVTAKIEIVMDPDARETVAMTTAVTSKLPKRARRSYYKQRGGRLLAKPGGEDSGEPDQRRLFDEKGNKLNDEDDDESVAGRVPATA